MKQNKLFHANKQRDNGKIYINIPWKKNSFIWYVILFRFFYKSVLQWFFFVIPLIQIRYETQSKLLGNVLNLSFIRSLSCRRPSIWKCDDKCSWAKGRSVPTYLLFVRNLVIITISVLNSFFGICLNISRFKQP